MQFDEKNDQPHASIILSMRLTFYTIKTTKFIAVSFMDEGSDPDTGAVIHKYIQAQMMLTSSGLLAED